MSSFEDGVKAGELVEKVREHDRRLAAINGSIDRSEQELSRLRGEVTSMKARVSIYAAIGAFAASIVGSILTGVVVYSVVHG